MSFHNKVCFEASTEVDGVKVSVEECAEYTSEISYEDAWFKAEQLAKEKAEKKLEEVLQKISKKDLLEVVKLRGPRGCKGSDGKNKSGDLNEVAYHFYVNANKIPKNLNATITKLLSQIPSTISQSPLLSTPDAKTGSQLNGLDLNTRNYIKVTTKSGLVIIVSVVSSFAYRNFILELNLNPNLKEYALTNLIITTDDIDDMIGINAELTSAIQNPIFWVFNKSTKKLETGYDISVPSITIGDTSIYTPDSSADNSWTLVGKILTQVSNVIVPSFTTNTSLTPKTSTETNWYYTDSTLKTIFTQYPIAVSSITTTLDIP